jgi:uncharacterized coiled-coil protein SlyX
MIARKKVVPPVTPKIVQSNSGQRLFGYVFLLFVVLLIVWFSYDYGRTHAPPDSPVSDASVRESEQRIVELEQERDTLKNQIEELNQSVEQINQALEAAQARIHELQQADSSPRETLTATPVPKPATTVSAATDKTLKLDNIRILRTESQNLFRIGFFVRHDADSSDRVTGTIWIAVNGTSGGKPTRLPLKTLSPERRAYVKMGFDQQQEVTEDVVLPEDFLPRNILIEAKPYGDDYTGTSATFDWVTNG